MSAADNQKHCLAVPHYLLEQLKQNQVLSQVNKELYRRMVEQHQLIDAFGNQESMQVETIIAPLHMYIKRKSQGDKYKDCDIDSLVRNCIMDIQTLRLKVPKVTVNKSEFQFMEDSLPFKIMLQQCSSKLQEAEELVLSLQKDK